ncbi:hypothetical protein [Halosimplex sp. J119]
MYEHEHHERHSESATFGGSNAQALGVVIDVADEVAADAFTTVAGVIR